MSLIHEPRVYRIRALQRAYSALQQELPFLEERVYLLRDVVAEPVSFAFHPSELTLVSIAEQQCDLGAALLERYMHLRERKDLDEAEPHLRTALQDLPLGHPRARCSSLLGSVLRECAFETKSTQMAGEALVIHRSLYADHIRPGVPAFDRAYHSRELGSTLHIYFQINKAKANLHTLFESLERLNEAHAIFAAREARAADHITLLTLCEVLLFLFGSQPNADKVYIEGSVAHGEHALATCGATHRDIFEITRKLARARAFLGFYSGDMGSVSIGIDLFRQALASAPSRWATLLSLPLTDTLLARYESQGHEEDLAEALVAGSVLAVTLKPGVEGWGKLQECLCRMRRYQFDITGRPEDIEAAASAANLACACTAVGTTAHLHRLVQLALCQLQQYNAFGDVTCLDECSKILELVMQLGAMQSRYWNEAARLLLRVYYLRYSEQPARDITDIRRAIALRSTMDPGNDVETRPDLLRYVGNILCAHFEATGALEDLEQATALLEEAASHSSHYTGHDIMQTYATVLRVRYEALHEAKSIVKALLIQEEALEALPEVHPDRAPALCGLAHLQLWASTTQGHASDALDHILGALNSHYCPAYRRLKSVSAILTSPYLAAHMPVLSDDNALKLCVVYSTVIDLLPQVASFGLGPRARLAVISSAGQLTIQGATHAISIGRFDQALEMLEAGRNVFWTQGLRLRTPFTDLPKTIGDRLTTISYALSRPPPEGADKGHELIRRRKLGDEFQSVLAEARLEPGFHDLLRNASFDSLARAAQHHPIIVFVAGEAYGHALIILGHGDCRHVPLQQATTKALQAISIHIQAHIDNIRSQRGIRRVAVTNNRPTDVYRKLWTLVMRPVLEALHWDRAEGRQRRRLALCPTGVFMRLPLHAAGVYTGKDQVCCSDYFVASYTPSIGALLHAQQSFRPVRRSSETETLVVAVDQPYQGVPLPEAITEANIVREHVSPSKTFQVSTTDGVLEHIQTASILHLACHGTQNLSDALQSGFHLEDGMLTISKLTELELPRAFLAVLDACETAKGDNVQPDQAIHLAGAMLFAGFKSVVATMWSMRDQEGPVVAESIYSALFKAGDLSEDLNPDDVPYALDNAVRKLRESGLDPSFWATYVHIGI